MPQSDQSLTTPTDPARSPLVVPTEATADEAACLAAFTAAEQLQLLMLRAEVQHADLMAQVRDLERTLRMITDLEGGRPTTPCDINFANVTHCCEFPCVVALLFPEAGPLPA